MVCCFLAQGFEEIEAIAPIDVLRRAGVEVITVGIGGRNITGSHGITVTADIADTALELTDALEMVILPGGITGTLNLDASETVKRALEFSVRRGRYIAAICAAPIILGRMSLLEGKRATCYTGFEKELKGAEVTDDPVCIDGKIITARGVGVTIEFALALVSELVSAEKSIELRRTMLCE